MPIRATALDLSDLLLSFSFDIIGKDVVRDDSPQGNDGEINGTVESVNGKYGKALEFSGAGNLRIPHISLNNRSFTVTMWVYPITNNLETVSEVLLSQRNKDDKDIAFFIAILPGGEVRVGLGDGRHIRIKNAIKAYEWSHISFSQDAENRIQILRVTNETLKGKRYDNRPLYTGTSGDMIIGSQEDGERPFNGIIDEVAIWNYALTNDEITKLVNGHLISVGTSSSLATTLAQVKSEL